MTALPFILMGVGTAMSVVGQIGQGEAAQSAANYNAQMARTLASEQSQAAKGDAQQTSDKRRQMIGHQVALYGAAGVDPNSGSPLDVMTNTATEYERDIQSAGIKADQATQAGEAQASLDEMQGRQAMMAGWIGAASSLFSGAGQGMYMYNKIPTPAATTPGLGS